MRLTNRSDSDMSSPYQRNDENQNKEPTSFSNINKNIDSDLEPLAKLRRDYPANCIHWVFKY